MKRRPSGRLFASLYPREVSFNLPGEYAPAPNNGSLQMTLSQAVTTRGGTHSTTIDNAIVSFNEGSELPKFDLLEGNARIYIPQYGKDYAIATVGRDVAHYVSSVDVNFKATENGTYTLTVNSENVGMAYLHLIDNMTGVDIDLLTHTPQTDPKAVIAGADPQSPAHTYTFTAKTTDYESRFRLVFSIGEEANDDDEVFAYINNDNIIITADMNDATLQIIDMMGRVIVSGDAINRVSTGGMVPGVYVLRLINGDNVKTQKIVFQ